MCLQVAPGIGYGRDRGRLDAFRVCVDVASFMLPVRTSPVSEYPSRTCPELIPSHSLANSRYLVRKGDARPGYYLGQGIPAIGIMVTDNKIGNFILRALAEPGTSLSLPCGWNEKS